jgi:hypothetical protein
MPRFVLLRHDLPPEAATLGHWDLMLQQGNALLTWRLETIPWAWRRHEAPAVSVDPPQFAAVRLDDHRLAYLDYEGPVSSGRGEVCRIDGGWYYPLEVNATRFYVQLSGDMIKGYIWLEHDESSEWRMLVRDERFL